MDLSKIHVITSLTNPIRYKSRYKLYDKWLKHMHDSGINPWTVEVAFGHRKFHTDPSNPRNLQMRSHNECWLKECSLNLLVQRLPDDWEYVCVIDADVDFIEYPCGGWLEETWHQLQHYEVIQMWENAIDMKSHGGVYQLHKSFMYCYLHNEPYSGKYGSYYHPGFAWAYSRKAWNGFGGLIDHAILGSGDHHMANCLIGMGNRSLPKDIHQDYKDRVLAWEKNALSTVKMDVGYLPTTIRHHFHGPKKARQYVQRWKILIDNGFDPDYDLKRDHNGLWQLTDRNWKLRDGIRAYFRGRNEDSIENF